MSFLATKVLPPNVVEPDPPRFEKPSCWILPGATDKEINECADPAE